MKDSNKIPTIQIRSATAFTALFLRLGSLSRGHDGVPAQFAPERVAQSVLALLTHG